MLTICTLLIVIQIYQSACCVESTPPPCTSKEDVFMPLKTDKPLKLFYFMLRAEGNLTLHVRNPLPAISTGFGNLPLC